MSCLALATTPSCQLKRWTTFAFCEPYQSRKDRIYIIEDCEKNDYLQDGSRQLLQLHQIHDVRVQLSILGECLLALALPGNAIHIGYRGVVTDYSNAYLSQ